MAAELGRNAVLIELNPVYVEMQKKRLAVHDVIAGRMDKAIELENEVPSPQEKLRSKPGFLWDEL